jgi:outer membrane protein TolC
VGLDSEATWQTVAGVTLRQALGRNAFGSVDRADLAAARLREEVVRAGYERAEQEVAARIEHHFWLAAVAEVVADTQTTVVYRLGRLLEENRRRVEDGLLDETAVLAVEASLAVAEVEAERLRDEAIVRDEELKDLIDLPPGQWDRVRIVYRLPDRVPEGDGGQPGYAEVLTSALASRADVEALRREAGRAEQVIRARTADDRGEFSVLASLGRGDADTEWEETFDFDRTVWSVGAMARLSLGRSASRAALTQALIAREVVWLDQEALERRIALEVRTAVRQRETARRLVVATGRALTAQRRKVERELERFRQGRSDISVLLDAETDRDLAERDAAKARGDLARAEVAWRLAQGLPSGAGGAR